MSGATSYQEMGEYWDEHDLADVWDQTEPVDMELDLESGTPEAALDALTSDALPVRGPSGCSPEPPSRSETRSRVQSDRKRPPSGDSSWSGR